MKLTIRDIAKMANVSPTAVSFVINKKGSISDETRRRIEEVIRQTGFRPSINSRRLSAKKSFNICVVMDVGASLFSDMFYLGVTKGIQQEASALGYNIVLTDFSGSMPEIVLNRDTDGVIFFQDLESNMFDIVRGLSVPFVVADSHISHAPYPTVGIDNQRAAHAAIKHLLDCGHRDIAFLGPKNYPHLFESTHSGYNEAHMDSGLIPQKSRIYESDETTTSAGATMAMILDAKPWPTAVFCPGDRQAIGAMLRAQELGARVPEDISFMSIDDTMLCRYVRPQMTTVHIDMEQLGVHAMRLLHDQIDGKPTDNIILPMDEVVERDSVRRIG
ncbi:LacI family transcriptional regulator [Eubacteriales bacterium OttesenSCG-928-N13]|nr:LacI family transcriptional regulator [Eubacteriales bacterium OttesenSCG-928-N13]